MMRKISVCFAGVVLLLTACQKQPDPIKAEDTGRPETKSIEAADAMGYNGKEIRQKVDGALDANDAHNAKLEQMNKEL